MRIKVILTGAFLFLSCGIAVAQMDFGVGFSPDFSGQPQKKIEIPKSPLAGRIAARFKIDGEIERIDTELYLASF